MSLHGLITGAATSAAQIAVNVGEGRKARRFQAQQSEISRRWNLELDKTQVQRRMADLAAAGVNPILAGMGGLSGSGHAVGAQAGSAGLVRADLSSGAQVARAYSQRKVDEETIRNLDSKTHLNRAEQFNVQQQSANWQARTAREVTLGKLDKYRLPAARAAAEWDATSAGSFAVKADRALTPVQKIPFPSLFFGRTKSDSIQRRGKSKK